jgi:hypothetical protein
MSKDKPKQERVEAKEPGEQAQANPGTKIGNSEEDIKVGYAKDGKPAYDVKLGYDIKLGFGAGGEKKK